VVRAKICGITRLEDALLAEQLGAWALGFVLAPGTRRYMEPVQVSPIAQAMGPFMVRVGVFVDAQPETVLRQMQTARLQVAQLHGKEPPEWAEQIRQFFPVSKAIKLIGPAQPNWVNYPADALLLDGVNPGSGQSYPLDWIAPLRHHPRLIIAGGLNPENLQLALDLHPYAVDVSSGVEVRPGHKDRLKVRQFLDQVAAFNATNLNQ
jgi:phosphoribosylanthranilate isomerase